MNAQHFFSLVRAFLPSLYINFKHLPFKQAIKLPILIYKPHDMMLKGKIIIDSEKIYTGMIRLGFMTAKAYPNFGIKIHNQGKIVFKGQCNIGNDSYIVVGKNGNIEFGDCFAATTSLKLISMIGVYFGEYVSLGWETTLMDANFHPLYDIKTQSFKKSYGKVEIGSYNWFGTQCLIMHSTKTPERCIFGARSIVNRGFPFESYCVHGGSPLKILTRNVMRDYDNDHIENYI